MLLECNERGGEIRLPEDLAARDWVASTDEPNARLIAATRHRADVQFRWDVAVSGAAG